MKNLILALLLSPAILLASENIFDNMDEKTSVTTGIIKLSHEEKTALIKWLNADRSEEVKQAVQEAVTDTKAKIVKTEKRIAKIQKKKSMGFRKEESEREEIHSSIIGEFKGWRGKNIFKLENGQIWKQSERSTFYIPKRTNPKITIKPKSMGSWSLYVDGFGSGVKVKRIK